MKNLICDCFFGKKRESAFVRIIFYHTFSLSSMNFEQYLIKIFLPTLKIFSGFRFVFLKTPENDNRLGTFAVPRQLPI